jgi:hypothetical protein
MPRQLDLGSQSSLGRHPHAAATRHVNAYAVPISKDGKLVGHQYRTVAGLADYATLQHGAGVRRMIEVDGAVYVVAGRVVYRVDATGTAEILGAHGADGLVTMARNARADGAQIGIVGGGMFSLAMGSTLREVNDEDLPAPNSIFYLGGYFMFSHADGRITAGELEEGDAIDATSFATATANPDGLLVGKPRGRDGVFFGPRSAEIWTLNEGGGEFVLSRRSALATGAFAAGGVIEAGDTLYWLSTTEQGAFGGVRILVGDQSQEVGSDYVHRVVSRETSPAAITGTTWAEDGTTFVSWSGTDWTLVLNTRTGYWHERESRVSGVYGRWRVAQTVQAGSRIIAGDGTAPKLYTMSPAHADEAGTELVMTLQSVPLTAFPGRVEVNEVHVDVWPGVGIVDGNSQDVEPEMAMQWSRDGETWSTERRRKIGRQGKTITRAIWHSLGTHYSSGLTVRLMASAKVVRGIDAASWDGTTLPT